MLYILKNIKQTPYLKVAIARYVKLDVATLSKNTRGMWQYLNSKKQQEQIDWRRAKVLEMMSKGENNQSEIARILKVDKSVISKDVVVIREQSRENLEKHIQERLPLEYQNCMSGIDRVIRMACDITEKPIDDKTRLQALSLLNECYKHKMDLTTNGVVITDAIKYVQSKMDHLDNQEKKLLQDIKQQKEKEEDESREVGKEETTNGVF
jgi:hypothetical protein